MSPSQYPGVIQSAPLYSTLGGAVSLADPGGVEVVGPSDSGVGWALGKLTESSDSPAVTPVDGVSPPVGVVSGSASSEVSLGTSPASWACESSWSESFRSSSSAVLMGLSTLPTSISSSRGDILVVDPEASTGASAVSSVDVEVGASEDVPSGAVG